MKPPKFRYFAPKSVGEALALLAEHAAEARVLAGGQSLVPLITSYGVKGGGEGGRMVAPPAGTSVVEDALKPFGIKIDEMPITPEKIVRWVSQTQAQPL